MQWLITGPLDESIKKFGNIKGCNIIINGDSEIFNRPGSKFFKEVTGMKNNFYCVRGGLDKNPKLIEGTVSMYDTNVKGMVYFNSLCPNFRFFETGEIYTIAGKRVLIIGDGKPLAEKEMMLNDLRLPQDNMLSDNKMKEISERLQNKRVDIVLSYTGPDSWEKPLKQDYTKMEKWLEYLKEQFTWKSWVFSRYRIDADIDNNIKEVYNSILFLDEI